MVKVKHPVSVAQQAVLGYAHGRHLEIGSHVGNSAILASYVADEVTCIDPFIYSTSAQFWNNLRDYNVTVELIEASSYPWPEVLVDREWETTFIDGEHSYNAILLDLINAGARTLHTMIVDDIVDGPQVAVTARAVKDRRSQVPDSTDPGTELALEMFLVAGAEDWEIIEEIKDTEVSRVVILRRRDAEI